MVFKRQLDGLDYRKAQKRNSHKFKSFNRDLQKELRHKGYKNLGWNNVCNSWNILQEFIATPTDLIEFARKKAEARYQKAKEENDLPEVLAAGKSIINSLKMKYQ
jgi:hypothetical protein